MAAVDDVVDGLIEQFHLAQGEVVKGNPEPVKRLYSHREDVTLANPYGPPVRGWEKVAEVTERATSKFRDGEIVGFEIIERPKVKVGGREDVAPLALRATMIFRPEDGEWKVVHWHADPITAPQPAESVIQE